MPIKLECRSLVCRIVKVFFPSVALAAPPPRMTMVPAAAEPTKTSRREGVLRAEVFLRSAAEADSPREAFIVVRSQYFDAPIINEPHIYLPLREAPFVTASKNWLTVSEPLAWLGGYSLNVWRNPPTIWTAGTMVQSFSPHHLP